MQSAPSRLPSVAWVLELFPVQPVRSWSAPGQLVLCSHLGPGWAWGIISWFRPQTWPTCACPHRVPMVETSLHCLWWPAVVQQVPPFSALPGSPRGVHRLQFCSSQPLAAAARTCSYI